MRWTQAWLTAAAVFLTSNNPHFFARSKEIIAANRVIAHHHNQKRQIEIQDGVRVIDFFLYQLMLAFPTIFPDKTYATPFWFLPQFKAIPGEFLRLLGFPEISFEGESDKYSFNKMVKDWTGVSPPELVFTLLLVFLANIVLVSVLLPNIYFRIMLWADALAQQEDKLQKL